MSDTIYRQEAIDAIFEHEFSNWCDKDEVSTILNDLPSADRPQGKWIAKTWHDVYCDNCGFTFDIMKCDFTNSMKYCPNCGIRKGADDE